MGGGGGQFHMNYTSIVSQYNARSKNKLKDSICIHKTLRMSHGNKQFVFISCMRNSLNMPFYQMSVCKILLF